MQDNVLQRKLMLAQSRSNNCFLSYSRGLAVNCGMFALVISLIENAWLVTVFKYDHSDAKEILIDLYDFAKDLEEVKDLLSIIRYRVEDEVVFSFRFMIEGENTFSQIQFKLKNLIPEENFMLNLIPHNPLYKYEAWPQKKTLKKLGLEKS